MVFGIVDASTWDAEEIEICGSIAKDDIVETTELWALLPVLECIIYLDYPM